MRNVMLDVETMGTRPFCPVLSIGAVEFDSSGLGRQFYCVLKEHKGTPDMRTVAFWMGQSEEARRELFSPPTSVQVMPYYEGLRAFFDFYRECGAERVWCHGATFDAPIVEAAAAEAAPWGFGHVRDTRTLYELSGVSPDRDSGVHHRAIDDAVAQAKAAVRAFAAIGYADVLERK